MLNSPQEMTKEQIIKHGIKDKRVIQAMAQTVRAQFVPEDLKERAYEDTPLPIGYQQTISQPFIVGFMTEAALLQPENRVLEIGTGSGYQAAILSQLCQEVYSIEIVEPLGQMAKERLHQLGYNNVHVRIADGYQGWEDKAPFDAILITAAPPILPQTLLSQLKEGGRLIVPLGTWNQELERITKTKDGYIREKLLPVRFVPMVHSEK